MSGSFGEAALQGAAIAARWLGWRPADFWNATPAELASALRDPAESPATAAPTRDDIARMMERDRHG